jgi:hypothetical protein
VDARQGTHTSDGFFTSTASDPNASSVDRPTFAGSFAAFAA